MVILSCLFSGISVAGWNALDVLSVSLSSHCMWVRSTTILYVGVVYTILYVGVVYTIQSPLHYIVQQLLATITSVSLSLSPPYLSLPLPLSPSLSLSSAAHRHLSLSVSLSLSLSLLL